MKFPSLIIDNFLAITHAEMNLADRGLVAIQGTNHDDTSADSNGAGKSSIPDAVCWCAYGTTARGASGDDVVNQTAGKGTMVQLVVDDAGEVHRITRHRKHKTGKNGLKLVKIVQTIGGATVEQDLTKGTDKLTQELVDRLLGASLEVFSASIYAGQEQMPDLPAMTDKALKVLIEEAAGTTLLEAAYVEARDRNNKARMAFNAQEVSINGLIGQRAHHEAQLLNAEAEVLNWEAARQARIAIDKAAIVPMMAEITAEKTALAAISEKDIEFEILGYQTLISAVGAENTKLLALEREVTNADNVAQRAARELGQLTIKVKAAEVAVHEVSHKIGCPCDECGRPLTSAELAEATRLAQARHDLLDTELQASMNAPNDAEQAYDDAVIARDAFKLTMTDTTKVVAQQALRQQDLNALRARQAKFQQLIASTKQIGTRIQTIAAEINPHEPSVTSAKLQVAKCDLLITNAQVVLKEAQSEIDLSGAVASVYSPAGVRAVILDDVTPFLNQQTAKYLGTLSDGNIDANWSTLVRNTKGELREKFTIEVENSKGGKIFKLLSGGEKRKVRVATALALQDLVATRAVKPIELFLADEIDDALDPAGLERLMVVLEEKAQERGSVFIVSHADLKDWLSNVVMIEKMPGGQTKITETTT